MSTTQQPITVLFDVAEMNQSQYDGIMQELEAAGLGSMAERLYHVACPNGNGWIVVDVWKSAEEFAKFGDTLTPIILRNGVTPPQPRIFPVYNTVNGDAERMISCVIEAQQRFNAGDIDGYIETLYAPDAVFHFFPPGLPQGHEGAKVFYAGFMAAFSDTQFTIDDMTVAEYRITVRYHLDMTHHGEFQGMPATGKRVTMSGISILRFADGKVVERWNQSDFLGLMMQLGALPAPIQVE